MANSRLWTACSPSTALAVIRSKVLSGLEPKTAASPRRDAVDELSVLRALGSMSKQQIRSIDSMKQRRILWTAPEIPVNMISVITTNQEILMSKNLTGPKGRLFAERQPGADEKKFRENNTS